MELAEAQAIATRVRDLLAPHCERIEIAGSIRRKCPQVGDIEIVAIPKPYETGLFENGVAEVINRWEKIKGELEYKGRPGVKACRYTQRLLPEGIKVDIFFANTWNWGYILAIRTGSAKYSKMLATTWKRRGYNGNDGHLTYGGVVQMVCEEIDLFNILNIPYCAPEARSL